MRPPTQHLLLDLLAARERLGEAVWTVPNTCMPAINALAADGLVGHKAAPVAGCQLVWFTDAGRAEAFGEGYVPPRDREKWVIVADAAPAGRIVIGPFDSDHDAHMHATTVPGITGTVQPMHATISDARDARDALVGG